MICTKKHTLQLGRQMALQPGQPPGVPAATKRGPPSRRASSRHRPRWPHFGTLAGPAAGPFDPATKPPAAGPYGPPRRSAPRRQRHGAGAGSVARFADRSVWGGWQAAGSGSGSAPQRDGGCRRHICWGPLRWQQLARGASASPGIAAHDFAASLSAKLRCCAGPHLRQGARCPGGGQPRPACS